MKKQFLVLLMLGACVGQVRGAEGNSSNTTVQVSLSKNQNGKIDGGTIDLYSTKEDGQRVSEDGFPKTISEAVAGIASRWKSVNGALFPSAEERLEIIKGWFPGDKKLQQVNKLEVVEKKKEEEAARIAREKAERDAAAERKKAAAEKAEAERVVAEKARRRAEVEAATKKLQEEKKRKKDEAAQKEADEREEARRAAEMQAQAAERERIAQEQAEFARLAELQRLEQERLATEALALQIREWEMQEAARAEENRLAAEAAERERIAQEEAVRIAEIDRALALEKQRLAELKRAEDQERERIARLEQEKAEEARVVAEQMKKYAEEQQRQQTEAEARAATQRVLDAVAADDDFKGLRMTCAVCPQSGIDQCRNFNADKFGRLCLRFGDSLIKYPLDFDKTFYLWKSRMLNDTSSRKATDREFSPLFRALYDCARGISEDLEYGADQRQDQEKRRYAQHYPRVEVPILESWSKKYPVLLRELEKLGFSLANLNDGLPPQTTYMLPPRDTSSSINSTVAKYFIDNGTEYEKGIFLNSNEQYLNDSNLYRYIDKLTEANLKGTQAGREALKLAAEAEAAELAAGLAEEEARCAAEAEAAEAAGGFLIDESSAAFGPPVDEYDYQQSPQAERLQVGFGKPGASYIFVDRPQLTAFVDGIVAKKQRGGHDNTAWLIANASQKDIQDKARLMYAEYQQKPFLLDDTLQQQMRNFSASNNLTSQESVLIAQAIRTYIQNGGGHFTMSMSTVRLPSESLANSDSTIARVLKENLEQQKNKTVTGLGLTALIDENRSALQEEIAGIRGDKEQYIKKIADQVGFTDSGDLGYFITTLLNSSK